MQYLLLVVALAVAVVLAARYVPMRGGSLFPEAMQQQMQQLEQMPDLEDEETPAQADPEPPPQKRTGDEGSSPRDDSPYYRWRGDDGSWHYGDRPPPGVEYEPVEPDPVTTQPAEKLRGQTTRDEGTNSD
jgi:hypothetical protein